MTEPAAPQPKTELQPTPRLAGWLSATSIGLFLEPLVPGAGYATVAALCVLLGLVWRDRGSLREASRLDPVRRRESIFSLGTANPVQLVVTNPTEDSFDIEVTDEPPVSFGSDPTFALRLDGGAAWDATYSVTPPKRGDYTYGGLNLRVRTPLGLLALQRRLQPQPAEVRVYPNFRDVSHLSVFGTRENLMRMGMRTTRSLEAGREFESLRDYRPGDEYRTLDWKASARRQQLTVRQYDVERSQKILLVLDLGRTMTSRLGTLTKADLAINACVMLAAVAARLDDRVGVLAFADTVLGFHPPARGRNQGARLLDFLYPLEAVPRESDYRRAFNEIAVRVRSRTLVVLFTDLVDPDSSSQLIAQLGVLARRHAVLCVALSDYELESILDVPPQDTGQIYRQAVAAALLDDRDQAAASLTARGVGVMKASPQHLSVQVVNRYLEWKASGRVKGHTA